MARPSAIPDLDSVILADLPLTRASIPRLIDLNAPLRLIEALVRVDQRLTFVARLVSSNRHDRQVSKGSRIDLIVLEDAWSHASKALLTALDALASATGRDPDQHLLELLGAVIAGRRPCVTQEGKVSIAGWAELRRHKRYSVDFDVELIVGDERMLARAENASVSGLGVTMGQEKDAMRLLAGSVVTVIIAEMPSLAGRIAWRAGKRAGIALNEPFGLNATSEAFPR